MGISYVKLPGTIFVDVYGITLRLDVGTELGSRDAIFDGSNNGKFGGLLHGYSLGYTYGKLLAMMKA